MGVVCPKCNDVLDDGMNFCPHCGCAIESNNVSSGLFGGLKTRVKILGDKTSTITNRAKGVVSKEKTSEAVQHLLDVVVQVARDVKRDLPPDMVKAIDLEAEISFIAFSIGLSVDLEQLQTRKDEESE